MSDLGLVYLAILVALCAIGVMVAVAVIGELDRQEEQDE